MGIGDARCHEHSLDFFEVGKLYIFSGWQSRLAWHENTSSTSSRGYITLSKGQVVLMLDAFMMKICNNVKFHELHVKLLIGDNVVYLAQPGKSLEIWVK